MSTLFLRCNLVQKNKNNDKDRIFIILAFARRHAIFKNILESLMKL